MSIAISPAEWRLEPLLSTGRGLGSRHLSLLGSAVRQPLRDVADVDLHLLIPRMDRSAFAALAAAAEVTVQGLAEGVGRPWRVEVRHGPFKPAPGDARVLQLHLLIDDEASLTRLPCALLLHRAATGLLLAGEPLTGKRADCGSPTTWLREARVELTRWRDALAADEIAFRHWLFDPAPHLAEGRIPAETSWDLRCLLKGAAAASDLCYRTAALALPDAPGDLALPLLSQLGEEPPWRDLAGCWERVKRQAITVIERRLSHCPPISASSRSAGPRAGCRSS